MLGYGMPDISALSLANPHDRERLRRMLQDAVARFEPRLLKVSVTLEEGRRDERSLHFRIDGLIDVDPEPEVVSFDSAISLHTQGHRGRGRRRLRPGRPDTPQDLRRNDSWTIC